MDVGDLGILAANYGQSGRSWKLADFNGDGMVDVSDLGILAANYGRGTGGSADMNIAGGRNIDADPGKEVDDSVPDGPSNGCIGMGLAMTMMVFLESGLPMPFWARRLRLLL